MGSPIKAERSEAEESLMSLVWGPALWLGHFFASYLTVAIFCEKFVGPGGTLATARVLCLDLHGARSRRNRDLGYSWLPQAQVFTCPPSSCIRYISPSLPLPWICAALALRAELFCRDLRGSPSWILRYMSLTHPRSFLAGALGLTLVWIWPLPSLSLPDFSSHMLMHMVVVAVAAPLLAFGVVGSRFDPYVHFRHQPSAIFASMLEFVAVWSWHAPRLHHLARTQAGYLVAEQATFLSCGVFLWLSALGGNAGRRRTAVFGGVIGLLLTSMHMILLGALLALAKRPLYGEHHDEHAGSWGWSTLVDQQVGGVIMVFLGAATYLAGGLFLARKMLTQPQLTGDTP